MDGRPVKGRPYKKSLAVTELEALAMQAARRKHPTCPHLAPRKFRDDSANGLTACIVAYITFKGGWASRINNQGTYRNGRYTRSTSKRGLADIMGTWKGLSLHIEVKIRDKQSVYQRQVEQEVIRSGGYYFVAHTFSEFRKWFDELEVKDGIN